MGIFTTSVLELVEEDFDFGLDKYPIFDESYREGLNQKILDHYMFYEIGQETWEQFRFMLNRKMNEIMPLYNQLYESQQHALDPFQTVSIEDITDTVNENTVSATERGTNKTSVQSDSESRNVDSQYPQTLLKGDGDYASAAADVAARSGSETDSESKGTTSTDAQGTGRVAHKVSGSQGHTAELLMRFRESFLNIDMMVINELSTLFMLITDSGAAHTGRDLYHYGTYYGPIYPL